MSTTTKIAIGATVVLLVGVGAQQILASPRAAEVPTTAAPAQPSTTAAGPSTPTRARSSTAVEMRAKRDRIREVRTERLAALAASRRDDRDGRDDDVVSDQCDDGCIGTLTLQTMLAETLAGCRDALPEGAQGKTKFRAHVIAEPDVGAVVDAVEVIEDTLRDEDFARCIAESAPLVQLADPENPVSDSFVFRYTVGKPPQPTAEFLAANPELLAAHPEFAALAKLGAGEAPSDEDATAFAKWIEADADAQAAFAKWATDEGLDLANVRVDR